MSSEVLDADRTNLAQGDLTHSRAVARMLERADAAAARADYADALVWLGRADALGDGLDPVYESRRARWRLKEEACRVGPSQWFG